MNSLRTLFVLTLVGLLAACGQSEDAPVSSGGSGGSGHSSANRGYKKSDKKAKLSDLENADLQAIQDIFAASNISNMEVRQNAKNWSYKAGFEPSCSAYQSFYNSQRLLYADIAPQIQALKLQTVLGKELVATLAQPNLPTSSFPLPSKWRKPTAFTPKRLCNTAMRLNRTKCLP